SRYGLQGGMFRNELDVGLEGGKEVETGGVVMNGRWNFRVDDWGYGGIKGSGVGREGRGLGMEEMTERKMVVVRNGL
ncbi:aldehyde dehydrogenase family protein, partial [Bacillus sp. WP8]|uniref:aldehyde dehydrogenase family protein n=1 Tax=Bacillus sp. WP8 TaxID=756828 RepID=UPI0011A0A33A